MDKSLSFSEQQKFYFQYFSESIQKFSIENPFLLIFIILLFTFLLEVSLPKRLPYDRVKRKGFLIDIFYVLIYDFILLFLGIYALTVVSENLFYEFLSLINLSKTDIQVFDIHNLHVIFQIGILFIVADFFEWLAHYLMHRFDFLWAFHKIHHAQEEIGIASSRHFHIMEYLVFKPLVFLPLSLIGYNPTEFALYTSIFLVFIAFFTHANVKIPIGKLNYLINNPNTHIWHHAQNFPPKYSYGVNFASVLNIWDVLFGFYYLPKEDTPKLGVHDMEEVPDTIIGQFFYPFKYLFNKKNITNKFDVLPRVYKKKKNKKKK